MITSNQNRNGLEVLDLKDNESVNSLVLYVDKEQLITIKKPNNPQHFIRLTTYIERYHGEQIAQTTYLKRSELDTLIKNLQEFRNGL